MYCIVPHLRALRKTPARVPVPTQTKKKQSAISDQQSAKTKSHQAARKGLAQTCYFSLLIRRAGYASIRQPSGVRWCLIFENSAIGIQRSVKIGSRLRPSAILSALGDIG